MKTVFEQLCENFTTKTAEKVFEKLHEEKAESYAFYNGREHEELRYAHRPKHWVVDVWTDEGYGFLWTFNVVGNEVR